MRPYGARIGEDAPPSGSSSWIETRGSTYTWTAAPARGQDQAGDPWLGTLARQEMDVVLGVLIRV
ncbi:hypothetical protein ASD51_30835 [Streptomyces sp. Root55]|nr:hypothetical protein ASD51_30835 [Streptomyces sp. Root55]